MECFIIWPQPCLCLWYEPYPCQSGMLIIPPKCRLLPTLLILCPLPRITWLIFALFHLKCRLLLWCFLDHSSLKWSSHLLCSPKILSFYNAYNYNILPYTRNIFEMFYLFPKGRVIVSYIILSPLRVFLESRFAKNYYSLGKEAWLDRWVS